MPKVGRSSGTLKSKPERSSGAVGEHLFPSTTWEWKRVIVRRPPEANGSRAPQAHRRWFHLPPHDRRRPLSITVKYRGGAQGWIEVHARGSMRRVPGDIALLDLLEDIWR